MSERRSNRRFPLNKMLEATDLEDIFNVEIKNISETGVSFSSRRPLPLGSPVVLNLDDYPMHFSVETKIVWQRELSADSFLYGARFNFLEEAEELLMKTQIAALELNSLKAFGLF